MKVILSRKGFDSQYGGQASPIMPDGTLLSFPIPLPNENNYFSDLTYKGRSYMEIIKELNPKTKIPNNYTCHLDPDIRKFARNRKKGWEPLFGQTGSSQGHLVRKKVQQGDLFLFFGTFKETELIDEKLSYKFNAPEIHLIYGYLQIGIIYSDLSILPPELLYHPHAQNKFINDKNNCIYKASKNLSFQNSFAGAGCLNFHKTLILTKKGLSKSKWDLPELFRNIEISYHSPKSFKDGYFQSAAKGQEFIIDESLSVTEWATKIIINGTKK